MDHRTDKIEEEVKMNVRITNGNIRVKTGKLETTALQFLTWHNHFKMKGEFNKVL